MRIKKLAVGVLLAGLFLARAACAAPPLPGFDWNKSSGTLGWQAAHDVGKMEASPQGLSIIANGPDPYIIGPARDYPARLPLWLTVRLRSDEAGMAQVFFFADGPSEAASVRFIVAAKTWQTVRVPLPPLGPRFRLRFDPPGNAKTVTLASLQTAPRVILPEPVWPAPPAPDLSGKTFSIRSGALMLTHNAAQLGGFSVQVAGQNMATGWTRPRIGYLRAGKVRWLEPGKSAALRATKTDGGNLRVLATARDEDGATWEIGQTFAPSNGAVAVETRVTVNQPRAVVFLPLLTLLPGAGTFGKSKTQGLFAGLEYLDNDPSSSEADLIGPESHRQVPDAVKITFPLMAIAARQRWVALTWEQKPDFSALFDSPDRILHGGGHALGVAFPGSDGANRIEGNLLPYEGKILTAGQTLTLRATILGGLGNSVIPAVQEYVARRGLPPLPRAGNWEKYAARTSAGWLASSLGENGRYRHALPGAFTANPAGDAAADMEWLAGQTSDGALSKRLAEASAQAIGQVAPDVYNFATVGHVTYPLPALVFGHVAENANRADSEARGLLARFRPDGSLPYQKKPDGPDFGKTHFAPDANGLTAQVVARLLELATVSGDAELIEKALDKLRRLDKFARTVPRGAQTWEVPLHTPDILASAHLVRAYTLGYELTGDRHFLQQAREWAWSGVPFVYLVNPTKQLVGPYATIAVLGATVWVAPVWMGLPVQWCGLVYADALYRLLPYDSGGPWKKIADGITISGIQQTFPVGSDAQRQGLLPDSFVLRPQMRNDPAINPGTLFVNAVRLFDRPAVYDFRAFRQAKLFVHAPGAIGDVSETPSRVAFTVKGWPRRPYFVLISGLRTAPTSIKVDGKTVTDAHFDAGRLVLPVSGSPRIEIVLP